MYTVVTGLFDIGRGDWNHYRRPIEWYLVFFKNVLSLRAPMIIFCEPKFVNFVDEVRRMVDFSKSPNANFTQIIPTKLEELYMHKYKDLLFEIQQDPEYGKNHPNPVCPEIAIPMYSLVTVSKPSLLLRGSKLAKTEYCIWLDGGYTHSTLDLSKLEWNPTSLYSVKDKISMTKLQEISAMISDDPKEFSNQYIDILSGGFFGGYKDTIERVCEKYYEIVHEILTVHKIKDDDQYYWTLLAKRHPEMMNLISGSWFSALQLK